MTSSLTWQLIDLLAKPVDSATHQRAAQHVLDWIGCAVVGAAEPAGRVLLSMAATMHPGEISVIGGNPVASAEQAAFLNGGFGNVLEMDDVHRTAILHPGPVVVPAALAAAEAEGSSAGAFLNAVVRGYDADIRLGESLGKGHYAKWHNTATCGPFGSAAAVSAIMGLPPKAQVWALGNAATQSSGPWRCRHESVMTKQLHTARAAQAGYAAAALAAHGFTGPEFMLEGAQGFYDAMCPDPIPERLVADSQGPWKIWETSFKPWPACRHTHPAIDAALALYANHAADEIRAIRIETFGDARVFCENPSPTTTQQAKFSLEHAVAIVLADGAPTLNGFEPAALQRPDVTRLRNATSIAVTDAFDSAYPAHFGASVHLELMNGSRDTAKVSDALGDPENPVSAGQIEQKARTLMAAGGASSKQIDSIVSATLALPTGGTVAELSAAISGLKPATQIGISA